MNILVLGSDGRAHAFCWKLRQSELCSRLFIAPGNAGTATIGTNVDVRPTDFEAVRKCCLDNQIDLVLVGPEEPLVRGIYDFFKNDKKLSRIAITGPSASGARLEGSKAFAKSFMNRYGIPTARYREFGLDNYEAGLEYIRHHPLPVVLKADGLAAGKGVIICHHTVEALGEFELIVQQAKFGDAGKKVVVEEFLEGIELSVFVLTDGKDYVLFPEAKDYKRIFEGDKGPNTGGMGAVSPVPVASEIFMEKVVSQVIRPTIAGLQQEKIPYQGFLFFGLIRVNDEPYVIEYNCRMGDPETEVVLLRLKNDLVKLLVAADRQELAGETVGIDPRPAATIVAVSAGYPDQYKKGFPIDFGYLQNPQAAKHIDADGGIMVFHAGTRAAGDEVVTNGGRVLAVSALADSLPQSIALSLEILNQIHYEGMFFRRDIGFEFIR